MNFKKHLKYDIGVSGNYTTGNIGDMAIGLSFSERLKEQNLNFALFHKNIKRTKCNVTILGGGGVIHDHIPGSLEAKMKFLSGDNYLLGIGYQNISDKRLKKKFVNIVNNSKIVTVRDHNSYKKICSFADKKIYLTACPAFTLSIPDVEIKNRTAVNFRPWFGLGAYGDKILLQKHFDYPKEFNLDKAKDIYLENIIRICHEVENPVFIPFHLGDYYFAKKYIKNIPVLKYYPSATLTLKRIAESKSVVATRYHSNVFSILCNKPMISIAYAPKVKELASYCDISAYSPNEKIQELNFKLPANREKLINSAYKNFSLLFQNLGIVSNETI